MRFHHPHVRTKVQGHLTIKQTAFSELKVSFMSYTKGRPQKKHTGVRGIHTEGAPWLWGSSSSTCHVTLATHGLCSIPACGWPWSEGWLNRHLRRKAHPGLATRHIGPTPQASDTHKAPLLQHSVIFLTPPKKPCLLSPAPGRSHQSYQVTQPIFCVQNKHGCEQPTKS